MTRTMSEGTAMLTLPIKRQWFDEILMGTKTIEYREIKPYWTSRFMKVTGIEGDPEEAVWKLKRRFNGQNVYFDALLETDMNRIRPSLLQSAMLISVRENPNGAIPMRSFLEFI